MNYEVSVVTELVLPKPFRTSYLGVGHQMGLDPLCGTLQSLSQSARTFCKRKDIKWAEFTLGLLLVHSSSKQPIWQSTIKQLINSTEGCFEAMPSPKRKSSLSRHKKSYALIHLEWAVRELIFFFIETKWRRKRLSHGQAINNSVVTHCLSPWSGTTEIYGVWGEIKSSIQKIAAN